MEKISLYRKYHKDPDKYPGESYEQNHEHVLELARDTGCKTFLDYGCGKGEQWNEERFVSDLGSRPHCYDPAVEKYSDLPDQKFDMVISTDVFEHIPEIMVGIMDIADNYIDKDIFPNVNPNELSVSYLYLVRDGIAGKSFDETLNPKIRKKKRKKKKKKDLKRKKPLALKKKSKNKNN